MSYTVEQIAELDQGLHAVVGELEDLWINLARDVAPLLKVERAREYIGNGACRRLRTIRRCIDNIFRVCPPRRTKLLSEDERYDLQINLHAFCINIHGVPDNLAWAYLLEKGIALKPYRVGLFCVDTQEHLPPEICAYLASDRITTWHQEYAKNFRDALAHRIPPYVPPSIWSSGQEQQYRELDAKIYEATKNHDFDRVDKLNEEQDRIGAICPAFIHSSLDRGACPPVLFHPQVIADARTVMEIVSVVRPHLPWAAKSKSAD